MSIDQQNLNGSALTNQYLGRDYDFKTPNQRLVDQDAFKPVERPHNPHLYRMKDTETVEGRLAGILSRESPLMQRAKTGALQQANSRGLLNSTMAVGAAHGAMVDKALPIAQQDAQQSFERGNLELDHRLRKELVYVEDELKRNQMALEQAIDQGNMQLAAEIQAEINNQEEFLARGRMELSHMQTLDRDRVQHGYTKERDHWLHGHNMERDQALYSHNMARDSMRYSHETNLQKMGQDHQKDIIHLENDYRRLSQYESGMTNTWNAMMDSVFGNPNATPAQMEHAMNQWMPIMKNQRDFMQSLYWDVDPKGLGDKRATAAPPLTPALPTTTTTQPTQPIQTQPVGSSEYMPAPTSGAPKSFTLNPGSSGGLGVSSGGGW